MTKKFARVATVRYEDPLPCPYCGRPLPVAAATDAYGDQAKPDPDPDDVDHMAWNMCGECGELGVIEIGPLGTTTWRKTTDRERARFFADPKLAKFYADMQENRRRIRARRAARRGLN